MALDPKVLSQVGIQFSQPSVRLIHRAAEKMTWLRLVHVQRCQRSQQVMPAQVVLLAKSWRLQMGLFTSARHGHVAACKPH